MRRAGQAGLDVVALTDHDTMAGQAAAARALPPGLALVAGLELSGRLAGHSVHQLAYGADPADPRLAAECTAIVEARRSRGRRMVERLRELGVAITWPQVEALATGGVVGRHHRPGDVRTGPSPSRPRRSPRNGSLRGDGRT